MDVSIIIVNWNTKDRLKECLRSIFELDIRSEYEVIVVDNASRDGSAEMVKREFSRAILIENRENRGFAAANNIGIKAARGRYFLLLNSDAVLLENIIDEIICFADSALKVAVAGCRVLNPDRTLQPTCFMFPSVLNMLLSSTYMYKLFPRSRFFGREQMTWWDRDDAREVDVVTGCFMLVRREATQQVGILDERYFVYGEETDWCYRFKKAGWKVMFLPIAGIVHYGGQSTRQEQAKMILQLRGSILLFMKKHKSFVTYALACLLVAIFFLLRVPYWLFRAAFARNDKSNCLPVAKAYLSGAWKALSGAESLC